MAWRCHEGHESGGARQKPASRVRNYNSYQFLNAGSDTTIRLKTNMTPTRSIDAELLAQCEKEPIHIPGAIQPFGILLTVERQELRIQNASENCASLCGVAAEELIGCTLSEFLPDREIQILHQYLATASHADQNSLHIKIPNADQIPHKEWKVRAHEHQGVLFLEWEPAGAQDIAPAAIPFHRRIGDAINALHRATGLTELCEAAAQQVKDITGFDRVMIYRFDTDWHGFVIAEARSPHMESYLDLHFPAADIPPQARAVFLQNWLRMIPDVNYVPSKIHPGRHPESGEALDLGKAMLRSVSPLHIQYLKNMDVMASLTVSLIDNGKLWGLIACHHSSPLPVDTDARIAAQIIGQLASSQLHIKEAQEHLAHKAQLRTVHRRLVSSLHQEDELAAGLFNHASDMLAIAGAQSGAICYKKNWTLIGNTPSIEDMETILAWLSENMQDNGLFQTDSLAQHIPCTAKFSEKASGLLAIELTKAEQIYILWFRPEVATSVTWAGAPEKTVVQIGGRDRLHPRASFKSWKETVTGKALPWKAVEIEMAEQMRNSLLSVALQQELQKEQDARTRAEKLSMEKEEMVMVVSHDLRTPLNIVSLSLEFLQRAKLGDDPVVQRMIDRGAYGAQTMETLISEILDVSKIESGTMELSLKPESADGMAKMAVDVFEPLAKEKDIYLTVAWNAVDHLVLCEKNRIQQVLSNLIGNALKFTPPKGEIIVSTALDNEAIIFCVADSGSGIPAADIPKVFDRFWQAKATKLMGAGLGLWISKSIIEKHEGKIWVTSESGVGTKFYFSLPLSIDGS